MIYPDKYNPLPEYFKRRTQFELDMHVFFNSVGFVLDTDYNYGAHMFVMTTNVSEFLLIDYDFCDKILTGKFSVEFETHDTIKFKTFKELKEFLYTIREIKISLREKKIQRILEDEGEDD